jgi:hypothetical protein
MAINKTSSFRHMVRGIIWWVFFVVVCSILLFLRGSYSVIIWFAAVAVFGWFFSFLSNSNIADIELDDGGFSLVTFFKKTPVDYNDLVIYEITRNPRPFMFLIHTNKGKFKTAYTDDSYSKIKELLVKTKSEYSVDRFETVLSHFAVKPYPSE